MAFEDELLKKQDEVFSEGALLKNLADLGEKLKTLKLKVYETEQAFNQAKKEYEHYANNIVPQQMAALGLESFTLKSGGSISTARNFYCNPNKNAHDQAVIRDWLKEHGGDHLLSMMAKVDSSDINRLKEAGIDYVEESKVNTNSMKAFVKSLLGVDGGTQQIDMNDIPECMHFFEVVTVDVQV